MKPRNFEGTKKNTEIVTGLRPIHEILRVGKRKIHQIWVAGKETGGVEEIIHEAASQKIPVTASSREEIYRLSSIEKHQGIAARVSPFEYATLEQILEAGKKDPKGHFLLILDSILDPQNLGSMIRTAHLVGVHGIILPERNSASIGPASTRASAGAVEYIPIVQVTNIARTLEILKKEEIWIMGADMGGEDLYSQDFSGSYAFVVGSEGSGIRRLVKEGCDKLISIPMAHHGKGIGSYNVSVAAGIFLSEVMRQRCQISKK